MIEITIPFDNGDPGHHTQLSFSAYDPDHARRGLRKALDYLHSEYGPLPPLMLVIWEYSDSEADPNDAEEG